jgi:hypothetical protein
MARRQVTKEEFDAFVASYPAPLTGDVYRISEPPQRHLNDFSNGKVWPKSVVASVELTETYGKDDPEPYRWKPNTYFLHTEQPHG